MERRKLTGPLLVLGLVAFFVYGAYDAHTAFRPLCLWQDAAHKAPASYRPQLNASRQFLDGGMYAFALAYAERAIAIRPDRASGWINASSAAAGLKAYHLAYQCLLRAFDIYPARQVAENLIYVCRVLGKNDEAEAFQALLPHLDSNLRLDEPTQ